MDSFLQEIDTTLLKKWLLNQSDEDYLVKEDRDNIIIETKYGIGHVNFYPNCMIELEVENKYNQEKEYFIHFQMKNFNHALGLLYDMKVCLQSLRKKVKTKVLLSCSSGLTTGYFVDKLNEAALLLDKPYEFFVSSYNLLYEQAKECEVILLAPQISYHLVDVKKVFKNKLVLTIPSVLFGKYDVGMMFDFLDKEINSRKEVVLENNNPLPIKHNLKKHGQVLALAFIRLGQRVRLVSRVYNDNDLILEDDEIYKSSISIDDIVDFINTILYKYPKIELISISLPGVVYNGVVNLKKYGLDNCHLQAFLENKYQQKIVINNDVNTIVVGYYISQDEYDSISFLYQSRIGSSGGVGHIHRGHLIKGRHNIAGEIQYLPISFSDDYEDIKMTPKGALEWSTKYCLGITSMIAPEAIIIFNRLLSDEDELKNEMAKYMPRDYLPDIIKIESLREYMLLGCIYLGVKEMDCS